MRTFQPFNLSTFLTLLLLSGCGFEAEVQPPGGGPDGSLKTLGFQTAANLETGDGISFDPQVAVEPDGGGAAGGTALAVWIKKVDLNPFDDKPAIYHVYASCYAPTTTACGATGTVGWRSAVLIDGGNLSYGAWSPKIAMDDNGFAIAVWEQSDGEDCDLVTTGLQVCNRIYARQFSSGGSGVWGATTILDSGGAAVGKGAASPSIAIEPDGGGTAMAVYTQREGGQFRAYARRFSAGTWGAETNMDTFSCCSSFMTVFSGGFDAADNVGQWTSTAIDSNRNVHIAYYGVAGDDPETLNLLYSFNLETICVDGGATGSGCARTTAVAESVGQYTSIAVDSTGRVHISYYDATAFDLKYATCASDCLKIANWTVLCIHGSATGCGVASAATTLGQYTGIAVAGSGSTLSLHISYYDATATTGLNLQYATCATDGPDGDTIRCNEAADWTVATIDSTGDVGQWSKIAVDSGGRLHISYYDVTNLNLKYATCSATCTTAANWTLICVDGGAGCARTTVESIGTYSSIAVDSGGRAHISYYDATATVGLNLKYATCASANTGACTTLTNWTGSGGGIICLDGGAGCARTTAESIGTYSSIAVDSGGRAHISYYDATALDLKYATCASASTGACTTLTNWTGSGGVIKCLEGSITGCDSKPAQATATAWSVGTYSSIAVDSFGEVAIAYADATTAAIASNTVGLQLRLATSLGASAVGPEVAMDTLGRAISTFARGLLTGCLAAVKKGGANLDISDDPNNLGPRGTKFNSELFAAACFPSVPAVNQFDATTSTWKGALNINPGSPTLASSESTGSTSRICFQSGHANLGGNANLGAPVGLNDACVTFSQLRMAMDRTGNAFVVMKLSWTETEADGGCGTHNGADQTMFMDESANPGGSSTCGPPAEAWDDWNGNAIAAERYTAGAAWAVSSWSNNTFLYAHSNQAWSKACGTLTTTETDCQTTKTDKQVISNCSGVGLVTTETGRTLVECRVNAPQIAMSGDNAANFGTALAVYERFDGTNFDVYADCFTLTGSTCGTTAISATCTDPSLTDGWRSISCDTTTAFRGNGFAAPPANTTHTAGVTAPTAGSNVATVTSPYAVLNDTTVSRVAFAPHVAMDSKGHGLAVWAQKDATGRWRVYGMRFVRETGFGSRQTIDNYGTGSFYYSNPVVAMEWVNTGNLAPPCPTGIADCGSARTLFLETQLTPGTALVALDIRVRANQWTPP